MQTSALTDVDRPLTEDRVRVLRVVAENAPINAALAEFKLLAPSIPDGAAQVLLGLFDCPEKLIRLHSDSRTTPGANEILVVAEPSETFLRLLAAARAGNVDRALAVELVGHENSSPSVGVTAPMVTESAAGAVTAADSAALLGGRAC